MDRTHAGPYIDFQTVTVRYNEEVVGLRGVSLKIERGEFVFFCGKTGAGKSTLLKLITRDVRETSGKVVLNGRDLSRISDLGVPALRRQMGIVPQDFALLPRKRVWENVAYAMRAVGHTRKEVRKAVPDILESVNIGHRADAFPHQLSGGEQQRVAIARALINKPKLLLADEPTGNLDPEHSMEIMELLLQLNRKGATILVASHDMLSIERLREVARVVTLESGQIVSDEKPLSQSSFSQMQLPLDAKAPVEPEAVAQVIDQPAELLEPAEDSTVIPESLFVSDPQEQDETELHTDEIGTPESNDFVDEPILIEDVVEEIHREEPTALQVDEPKEVENDTQALQGPPIELDEILHGEPMDSAPSVESPGELSTQPNVEPEVPVRPAMNLPKPMIGPDGSVRLTKDYLDQGPLPTAEGIPQRSEPNKGGDHA